MLWAITSFMRNTLPPRFKPIVSLPFRSHLRHFTSPSPRFQQLSARPTTTWDGVLDGAPKVAQALEGPDSLTAEERWQKKSEEALRVLKDNPPANAYTGRSVSVKGGNIADAYGRLQSILTRNKVQAQLRRAERHEKKGVKRRRLSSERWRRQFAHEVRRKVQLVAKIRNRGA
ncbi:hypothetical protein DXG01_014582 [Tephrocybe rancida]|nr:hypothetical protein DXG01_014582 [Tephrocybe rancida]